MFNQANVTYYNSVQFRDQDTSDNRQDTWSLDGRWSQECRSSSHHPSLGIVTHLSNLPSLADLTCALIHSLLHMASDKQRRIIYIKVLSEMWKCDPFFLLASQIRNSFQ